MNYKFDFDDILLEPDIISEVNSRSSVDIHDVNRMLPIFTAPMDTVVNSKNIEIFVKNAIYGIFPRTLGFSQSHCDSKMWVAVGLKEFKTKFIDNPLPIVKRCYVLIDIANGHQKQLHDIIIEAKKRHGTKLIIMAGNVAHPLTYKVLSDAGADYIRLGIGFGSACLTSVQTGCGSPMASLIVETYEISRTMDNPAKIVADGGMRKYSDIIKALALGADYVMLGGIFNKALESAGDTFAENKRKGDWLEPGEQVDQYSKEVQTMFKYGAKYFKKFRGMSTKEVQKELGNTILKTSEGINKIQSVEYTIEGWVENFEHYLRSAMSYTGCKNLEEFRGNVRYNLITQNALNRFQK